jgi:hypothetical protein
MRISEIKGWVTLKTTLDLNDLGKILSKTIFSNIPFVGEEENIHEHIPAVYLEKEWLGLRVELGGFSGFLDDDGYSIIVKTSYNLKINSEGNWLYINSYLFGLFMELLKDYPEIQIIENKAPV